MTLIDLSRSRDASRIEDELHGRLSRVTEELAGLNRDLAAQMVRLAAQTGETQPLIEAVQALRKVQNHYSGQEAPVENMEVHEELADTLVKLGRAREDVEALHHAVLSYRSAITLASLVGDNTARRRLRKSYAVAIDAMQLGGGTVPARAVA